jgi:hypothetical protein
VWCSARASTASVASWDALESDMYSGAGVTLATKGGVVVKEVVEARDAPSPQLIEGDTAVAAALVEVDMVEM